LERRAAGYYRYSLERGFVYTSPSLLTLLGFDTRPGLETACGEWYVGAEREELLKAVMAPPFQAHTRAVWPMGSGAAVELLESVRAVFGEQGGLAYIEGLLEPVPRTLEQLDSVEDWRVAKAFGFTPRVRHSFNNLMTVVSGLSGILAEAAEGRAQPSSLSVEIRSAVQHVMGLFEAYFGMLDQPSKTWQLIDLRECLRESEAVIRAIAPAGVVFAAGYDEVPLCVRADPALIKVLLAGLVQEMLAADAGVQSVQCAVTRFPPSGERKVRDRLTRPHAEIRFQLHVQPGRVPAGFASTPLPSAAVMARIVELHGGTLEAGDDAGGAYYTIRLPLESEAGLVQEAEPVSADAAGWTGRTVLLVAAADAALAELLTAAGATVTECATSEAALRRIREQHCACDAVIASAAIENPTLPGFAKELLNLCPAAYLVTLQRRAAGTGAGRSSLRLEEPAAAASVRALGDRLFGPPPGAPVVLVTDDDPNVRLCLAHTLRAEGFIVLEAGDGRAALEVLQAQRVDLLVLDIIMPEQEGLATIRALCRKQHRMPIIAVSGNHQEYLHIAKLLGADATLRKPFSAPDLVSTAWRLLRRSAVETPQPALMRLGR
jgi:CheY-like chemotaxis protein